MEVRLSDNYVNCECCKRLFSVFWRVITILFVICLKYLYN